MIPFAELLAWGFLSLLGFVWLLNIFGLPANWIILGLVALWQFLGLGGHMGILFWIAMICIAILGEVLETGLQLHKARKYGCTSSGTWGGFLGSILGAILLAPLFFGIGAFIGALAGAWAGCFCFELLKGQPVAAASRGAWGAMVGRFLGTICKLGIGAMLIVLVWHQIWPAEIPAFLPGPPDESVPI